MGKTSNGRNQANLYKQELREIVENLVAKSDSENANAAVLSALGEVTAEFGIYAVGPQMTIAMFLHLADQVQIGSSNDDN